jgi:sterol desaturase/sphingolipid hydroxylase (fatty acid hydroxylase superfamily)
LVVAIIVYMIEKARRGQAETVPIMRWLLPKRILLHPSAQTDFAFYVINKILMAAIYASVLVTAPFSFAIVKVLLQSIFGPSSADFAPHWTFALLTTLVILLVLDFTLWFVHYLFHRVPFLWDYHKVHHSAEVMTPATAARMHPVEELFDVLVAGATIGAAYGFLDYLLGEAGTPFTLFEINVFLAIFYFSAFHLRHSHVWVRYPVWLQHIFICPAQHQVHHSVDRKHWDKNMGFVFAFWDWAFGTLYAPKGKEELTFGLGTEEDGGSWHSVRALYCLPFVQTWNRIRNRQSQRVNEPAE